MSWFRKIISNRSADKEVDEVIDPYNGGEQRNLEHIAAISANQALSEMETIELVREKEEQAQADLLVVVHGAKIKMGTHLGEFAVLTDVPTTQGKLTGTIIEKTIANFSFYDGFQLTSILGDWEDYGSYKVQDHEVLLKQSKLQVVGKMPNKSTLETGIIEIIDSGQVNMPANIYNEGVPVP